ncbi:MAG TPA: DMT family transporter [Hyphomicrobiaceae bacterium]|jgi:drug/metabolite transporter (DMT)-like permease|nr:DMT family transporter [Hyphomicrobiaceae bacterium]
MTLALASPARSENLRGIAAMLAAMGSLIVNDCFLKIAAAELPTGEAIFLRGLFATLLCVGFLAATGGLGAMRLAAGPWVQVRAGADVVATILYLNALMRMPIADATALLQFTPLAITAGAALFLGARVGWRRWLATAIGLVGVLIIVRPGGAGFNAYALLALSAIGFVTVRDLVTRRVGAAVPSMVIAATSSAAVAMGSAFLALFEAWAWPSLSAVLLLFLAGVGLLGGNYWIVVAMRTGEIAVVAPFRYSVILWAIAAGLVIWGEVPDLPTWIGIAVVTGAGVYTILRENRLARLERSGARPFARTAADGAGPDPVA